MNLQWLMEKSLSRFPAILLLILLSQFIQAKEAFFDIPVAYYQDVYQELTFADAKKLFEQDRFISSENSNLTFGYTTDPVWIHISLHNLEEKDVLFIQNAHLDFVDFYLMNGNSLSRHVKQGDLVDFHARELDYHYLNILIDPQTTDIFIRVSTHGPLLVPLALMSFPTLMKYAQKQQMLHFVYFGILLLAFCVNVLLYVWFREKNYLFYILSLLFFFIITCVEFGYLFQYVYPHTPEINVYNLAYYALIVVVVIFTQRFLNIRREAPFYYWVYRLIVISCVVLILAVLLTKGSVLIQKLTLVLAGYIIPVFILSSAAYSYFFLHKTEARFVFLGWLSNVSAVLVLALTFTGTLPHSFFTGNVVQIGSGFEVIFFFFALVERVNILKKEKEHLLKAHNQILEEKLEERMREINAMNQELIAQNEELQAQQDELTAQRNRLHEQNTIIEKQNLQLKDAKSALEQKVKEKTADLLGANQSLADKNQRLEQFAFVAAHNMRGPVATLAGLINLFNRKDASDPVNLEIIKNLDITVGRIDSLVWDLSALLDFTSISEELRKEVNLKQVWEDVKIVLKSEIDIKHAKIHDNLPCDNTYKLVPVYIHNIFYNVLSNALKYSSTDRPPAINIDFTEQNGQINIKATDNGLGIDLKLVKNKLFSPFHRFHAHVEGKGLGLFITKTQIEAMHGIIDFQSQLGVGTAVCIMLPKIE